MIRPIPSASRSVVSTTIYIHQAVGELDALHQRVSSLERDLFASIVRADRLEVWRDSGARDLASWLSYRYGISTWKASRWIRAAHALEHLPVVSEAFACGVLGVDKVAELCRFATPETEAKLARWAERVAPWAIRRRGDLMAARVMDEVRDVDRARTLSWWYQEDGTRFGLSAELPAAEGALVATALDRLARTMPVMPGEDDPCFVGQRRADALVAMASVRIARDADPDRATVVVHAQLETLVTGDREAEPGVGVRERSAEIHGGPVISSETTRRLACSARMQMVVETTDREALGMGRITRVPSAQMMCQLRYRDPGCVFPGCGTRRFAQAHHLVWWAMVDGRICPTWCCSASSITSWCTSTGGGSLGLQTAP